MAIRPQEQHLYFSQSPYFQSNYKQAPLRSWLTQAILSYQNVSEEAFSRLLPEANLPPSHWISTIVTNLKRWPKKEECKPISKADCLASFFLHLQDPEIPLESLQNEFSELDDTLIQTPLACCLASALKKSRQGASFGKEEILKNPWLLLTLKDPSGKLCLESLIEHLREGADASSEQILIDPWLLAFTKEPSFAITPELFSHKKDLLVSIYEQIAENYAEGFNSVSPEDFFSDFFSIQDPRLQQEIIKACAKKDSQGVITHIERFQIANPKLLNEVFEICFLHNWLAAHLSMNKFSLGEDSQREYRERTIDLCVHDFLYNKASFEVAITCIEDPLLRIEIAKKCADKDGGKTGQCIRQFNLLGLEYLSARLEIVKRCAASPILNNIEDILPFYIPNFNLEGASQTDLVEVAKLLAKRQGERLAWNFSRFPSIEREEDRIAIASECLTSSFSCMSFSQFSITDKMALKGLLKDSCHVGEEDLTHSSFKEEDRFEIAMAIAEKKPNILFYDLDKFQITDKAYLLALAKKLFKKEDQSLIEDHFQEILEKFQIDPMHYGEIASLYVDMGGSRAEIFCHLCKDLEPHIFLPLLEPLLQQMGPGYCKGITQWILYKVPPAYLEEHKNSLALPCAQKDVDFLNHWHAFSNEDPHFLQQIALACIKANPDRFLQHINDFHLLPTVKLEAAKLLAESSPKDTLLYLKKLHLPEEEKIEIARICIAHWIQRHQLLAGFLNDSHNPQGPLRFIREACRYLSLPDKLSLASLCAGKDGKWTSKNIKIFALPPQERQEILQICFQDHHTLEDSIQRCQNLKEKIDLLKSVATTYHGSEEVERLIGSLGIQDPAALKEIALVCARARKINPLAFGISLENQAERIEIAKVYASVYCLKHRQGIAIIRDLGIKDPHAIVEIAKFYARHQPQDIALYINSLEIQNPKDLIEIAKICAEHGYIKTAQNIHNFRIPLLYQKEWKEIALLFASSLGKDLFPEIDTLFLQLPAKVRYTLKAQCCMDMALKSDFSEEALHFFTESLLPHTQARLAIPKNHILCRKAEELGLGKPWEEMDFKEQKFLAKLCAALALVEERDLSEETQKTLFDIVQYRNEALMRSMLRNFTGKVILERKSRAGNSGESIDYFRLPQIFLDQWESQCSLAERRLLQSSLKTLREAVKAFRHDFKNMNTKLLDTWLLAAENLNTAQEIPPEQKIRLFLQSIQDKPPMQELKERLASLSALCSLKPEELLEDFTEETTKRLMKKVTDSLLEDPYLQLQDVENLGNKYVRTFGAMREILAWRTYQTQIEKTKNPKIQLAYQTFFRSVLDGTHQQERYARESEHRLQILRTHPKTWEKWSIPDSGSLIEIRSAQETWTPSALMEWLSTLQREHHFESPGKEPFCPDLIRFIKAPEEQRRALSESYQKRIEGTSNEEEKITALWMDLLLSEERDPSLFLQHLQQQLETVKKLLQSVRERDLYEICNDFESFLQQLKTPLRPDTFTVIDTDDWQDLFLSGTEVLGSCQRIDGSPHLNQCLLAYILDGKNRMLAVKDSKGRVIARSIFRLLWDEELRKPVLFQEALYSNVSDENIKKALYEYAKERARRLQCPLYTHNTRHSQPVSLTSLGSPAPFEYVDALRGPQTNGCFTLKEAYKVPLFAQDSKEALVDSLRSCGLSEDYPDVDRFLAMTSEEQSLFALQYREEDTNSNIQKKLMELVLATDTDQRKAKCKELLQEPSLTHTDLRFFLEEISC